MRNLKAKAIGAVVVLLMTSSASFAVEQGAVAGVPSNPQGGIEHPERGLPAEAPYDAGRSVNVRHNNSTTAIENGTSSHQGSGPRGGDPNGN